MKHIRPLCKSQKCALTMDLNGRNGPEHTHSTRSYKKLFDWPPQANPQTVEHSPHSHHTTRVKINLHNWHSSKTVLAIFHLGDWTGLEGLCHVSGGGVVKVIGVKARPPSFMLHQQGLQAKHSSRKTHTCTTLGRLGTPRGQISPAGYRTFVRIMLPCKKKKKKILYI